MKLLIEESVLRQALEAFELYYKTEDIPYSKCETTITALRSALDAAEKVGSSSKADYEPVAWMNDNEELYFDKEDCMKYSNGFIQPLYAAPTPPTNTNELREAARAVVERWDSPLWKDLPHTGEYIDRLRKAL